MTANEVINIIKTALTNFYDRDQNLLNYDTKDSKIGERTISARLAMYIQLQVDNLDVDCEYNRHIYDYKIMRTKKIYPDIIIHKRLTDDYNTAWIEIKKDTSNEEEINKDRERLVDVTVYYKYFYGILIIMANDLKSTIIEIYSNGSLIGNVMF